MKRRELQRILLVDDDEDIRRIAALGLERVGGMVVKACASGAEAVDSISDFVPDLVLLDVMMPKMAGPLVFEMLVESPDFEGGIIFVTAKAQRHEVAQYLEMGAIGVIKKPFDPMTLTDEVRAIWSDWRRASRDAEKSEEIERLIYDYRRKLDGRLKMMTELLKQWSRGGERADLEQVRGMAHKLAGSGKMFGLPEVSESCAEFEALLVNILEGKSSTVDEDRKRMFAICEELEQLLKTKGVEAGQ